MYNYYVAYKNVKKLKCGCQTLVVRNKAISEKYPGGLNAYIQRVSAICNNDISVAGYMGDDLDEDVRDLIKNGLKPKEDFTVIDVWGYEISLMISGKDQEKLHRIDLKIDWLEAEHTPSKFNRHSPVGREPGNPLVCL